MNQRESQAINIARLIFVIGVLFIHFPFGTSSVDGISLTHDNTPIYNIISAPFFLSQTCLEGLFILSGYLFFRNIPGGYSDTVYFRKIDSRIKSIVIPYMFWNIFWLGYNFLKTWKLYGVSGAELMHIDSMGDLFACFWQKGYGENPSFPIAGYTWFLRDLFVFALLSPVYNYCYNKKRLSLLVLLTLVVCEVVRGWHLPGFNTWIYVGGYIASRQWNFEWICNGVRWRFAATIFVLSNIWNYSSWGNSISQTILVFTSFFIIMKASLLLYNRKWLLSVASSSMYLYVTHILVLNISRHSLAKFIIIDSDYMMCVYYIINSLICVSVCLLSYYFLKRIKANRLLDIMTGGRA